MTMGIFDTTTGSLTIPNGLRLVVDMPLDRIVETGITFVREIALKTGWAYRTTSAFTVSGHVVYFALGFNDDRLRKVAFAFTDLEGLLFCKKEAKNSYPAVADSMNKSFLVLFSKKDCLQRFERAFGANPAPAIIARLSDMRYVKVNQGFLEMTGYLRDDIIGRSLHEIDVLQGAEKRDLAIKRLHAGETIPQMEGCLELPDGREKTVLLGGQPIEIGDAACMLFTFADLHPRQQAQHALRQSEERFAKAFHMAPGPMAIFALDGLCILDVNTAFTAATGWRREEVVGRSQAELEVWGQGEVREELERQLRQTGHLRSVDVQLRANTGGVADFLLSAETVDIHQQRCVLSVMQDITERKQTETQLLAAIEAVMQDASWFGQKIMEKLAGLAQGGRAPARATEVATLPDRAREVLGLVAQGLSDDDIAEKLGISRNTVRNHVSVIYDRIGIRKRSAVIVWARERGLGTPAKSRTTLRKSRRKPAA
jgi:PAS domain S-box-containing protein